MCTSNAKVEEILRSFFNSQKFNVIFKIIIILKFIYYKFNSNFKSYDTKKTWIFLLNTSPRGKAKILVMGSRLKHKIKQKLIKNIKEYN
jgi:hypothetical protein